MAAPRAYAIPIVGDGVNPGVDFAGTLIYDATLTPAQNLPAAKTKIGNDCANVGFAGVLNSNILIDITLQ